MLADAKTSPDASTIWRPGRPVAVAQTLGLLRHGSGDPCHQVLADGAVWRTSLLPSGPVTYRISNDAPDTVRCLAWGAGAEELVLDLPELLGANDDLSDFSTRIPLVDRAHRRHLGLRISRTKRVLESLVPAVLEQRVIGSEAFASWRHLVRTFGQPAPGPAPAGMRVPPSGATWGSVPSWEWHRAGVDPGRARTAIVCARHERQLQASVDMSMPEAYRRLRALPGVGAWTAAEVAVRALGDADAVSVGDYHLAAAVGWTFHGRAMDDDAMLQTLEPWRPHRGRVLRLLIVDHTLVKPRRGPRLSHQDFRRM